MMATPKILAYICLHCLHKQCRQCRLDVVIYLFAVIVLSTVVIASVAFCVGSVGNRIVIAYAQACIKDTQAHTHKRPVRQMPALPTSPIFI